MQPARSVTPRILVAGSDPHLRGLIRASIVECEATESSDAAAAAALALSLRPSLIVLDARCVPSAVSVVSRLRRDFRTAFIPILFVVDERPLPGALRPYMAGADDYIVHPFERDELVSRVDVSMQRSAASRWLNPLTGLPGNIVINEEIAYRLAERDRFACLHIDLDNFKAFNDRYGFTRGDAMIRTLAWAITGSLEAMSASECFAGHLGGDDFVVLVSLPLGEVVAQSIVERFRSGGLRLYDPADRDRGWIEIADRRGRISRVPLCTVSIGIASSERGFATAAQMTEVAAEVKGVAKRRPGSNWAVDRRKH